MTASTDHTCRLVEELLCRIAEGEPARIAELFAERCDWKLDWPETERGKTVVPWIRHRSSRSEIAEHYSQIAQHHVPEHVDTVIERVLVDGEDAVVLGVIGQTPRTTGIPYRARFALHPTFEGGLVTRHHIYEDSLAVADAFGAR